MTNLKDPNLYIGTIITPSQRNVQSIQSYLSHWTYHQSEFTDAGPGVGVNNTEVSFRDAEISRIYQSDYRIRVHRAAGDSKQNEAERTNSVIGDSVVDGETINRDYHQRFEGLTEDEISSLSLEEYEKREEKRMGKNGWKVAEEVAARIE